MRLLQHFRGIFPMLYWIALEEDWTDDTKVTGFWVEKSRWRSIIEASCWVIAQLASRKFWILLPSWRLFGIISGRIELDWCLCYWLRSIWQRPKGCLRNLYIPWVLHCEELKDIVRFTCKRIWVWIFCWVRHCKEFLSYWWNRPK